MCNTNFYLIYNNDSEILIEGSGGEITTGWLQRTVDLSYVDNSAFIKGFALDVAYCSYSTNIYFDDISLSGNITYPPYYVQILSGDVQQSLLGYDQHVPIFQNGNYTGYHTPHIFSNLTDIYVWSVENVDSFENSFNEWLNGITYTFLSYNINITLSSNSTIIAIFAPVSDKSEIDSLIRKFDFMQELFLFNVNHTEYISGYYDYENLTWFNVTTLNWIKTDVSTVSAFMLDIKDFNVSNLISGVGFDFSTTTLNDSNHNFGFFIYPLSQGYFIVSPHLCTTYGATIVLSENVLFDFQLVFMYNQTTGYFSEKISITDTETRQIIGTSFVTSNSTGISFNDNNELSFGILYNVLPWNTTDLYNWYNFQDILEFWIYIPYTNSISPSIIDYDATNKIITINQNTLYSFQIAFNLDNIPNTTTYLYYTIGNYSFLHPPNGSYVTHYGSFVPTFNIWETPSVETNDDSTALSFLSQLNFAMVSQNNLLKYEPDISTTIISVNFFIDDSYQNGNTNYKTIKISVSMYLDLGTYPNFTYSNIVPEYGEFIYTLKLVPNSFIISPPETIVNSFGFLFFLIILVVPFMICVLMFWRRLHIYSVIFGAVVDFVIAFLNPQIVPLWFLFIIGGGIVLFFYLKLSSKTQGKI